MKKIKKLYRENRILLILLFIVIICVIAMGLSLFKYFYTGDNDKWGDRLEAQEKVPISESRLSEITMKLKEDASTVSDAKILPTGNRFDFIIYFQSNVTLVEAQSLASKILDEFSDEEKTYYDFHFALVQNKSDNNDGFTIEGTRTANGKGTISWNANNEPSSNKEENE